MRNKNVQQKLKELGLYTGAIDGILGPESTAAILAFQRLVGLPTTGNADKETLAELLIDNFKQSPVNDGSRNFPPSELDVEQFYGKPGTNQVLVSIPYKMKLAWDASTVITKFSCNKLVKDNIQAILEKTLSHYGIDGIEQLHLNEFGGCLNVRKMRGGERMSMHSYGIAIDLYPAGNRLRWNNTKAEFAKPVYNKFWHFVGQHGGISLGRTKNYDWMHFQFARP